ncbi:MAG: flagellar hook-length control protein FliK [Gammaproteobacteria bacterium]|nr:flagellar hook-length control protein FliK [Gammaproteobacteria bacterium]
MSTSQALMALFSSDLRASGAESSSRLPLTAGDAEAFSAMLAEQLPSELEAAIQQMSSEQLASLEQTSLAASGNSLPLEVQDWLQQLPDDGAEPVAEDALAVISQWMQLLQQDSARPATAAQTPAAAVPVAVPGAERVSASVLEGEPVLNGDTRLTGERAGVAAIGDGDAELLLEGERPRVLSLREQSADSSQKALTSAVQQGNQLSAQQGQIQQTQQTQQSALDFSTLLQRSAAEASPGAAALFGKLVEQIEGAGSGRGADTDAVDGLEGIHRSAAQTGSAALTARPVAGAMQPAAVPFGHQSWGEAMVERVMWMSSQNLRSVEIQLDPAELGPLEIHIQNRGQELQVQFISQNPGVREALEGQMHRLREMFAGQGLEQAEVTVADRSAGEQARQGEGQLADRSADQGAGRGGQSGALEAELTEQPAQRLVQPLRGLVDYYV